MCSARTVQISVAQRRDSAKFVKISVTDSVKFVQISVMDPVKFVQINVMDSVKFPQITVMNSGFIRGEGRANVRRKRARRNARTDETGSSH